MDPAQQTHKGSTIGKDPPASTCPEGIAIVGMGCRWPGGVSNSSGLWDLLKTKGSGYQDFADKKIPFSGFYHPDAHRPGSFNTKGGHFLRDDARTLDHAFFGISPSEATTMDPTQRKLLEVVYEAFEDAGEPWSQFSGSRTGVFVGNFNLDHGITASRDVDRMLPYTTTGVSASILSNRVNFVFNLLGPSLTLDTACSSSMYALHLAVNALRNGDCDSAIVAGTNLILTPDMQLFSTKLGAMSPTSKCHTFDESADGYSRSEGFGALYLKRVSEAVRTESPIRAVIRGTAVNANGRGGGITHPSSDAQERVIRAAFHNAGNLNPALTGYFECHGTGTPVGDPLEVAAIGRVFAPGRSQGKLLIGSIKTNLGHTESASGIAGIMKAVLAIEHGLIPPTIGLVKPNPNIDFEGAKVEVVTEMTPWPVNGVRRACVNSFGYGGANAHCILDHPSSVLPDHEPKYPGADINTARCNSQFVDSIAQEYQQLNGQPDGDPPSQLDGHRGHLDGEVKEPNGQPKSELHTVKTCIIANGAATEPTELNGTQFPTSGHDTGPKREQHIAQPSGLVPHNYAPLANGTNKFDAGKDIGLYTMRPKDNIDRYHEICGTQIRITRSSCASSRALVVIPFSSHTENSLHANIAAMALGASKYNVADLVYTLSDRRSRFFQRGFAIANSRNVAEALNPNTMYFGKSPSAQTQRVGFVFTGQGAQWPGMGAELFSQFAVFKSTIQYMDAILAKLSVRPAWTIENTLLASAAVSRIQEPEFSQTICTALQIALVNLLRSWNIQPVATVGHSSGEIAAAYAAGAHTAAESIILAFLRGQVVKDNKQIGCMLAVGLSAEAVLPFIRLYEAKVQIAAVNSPDAVTLSGDRAAILAILERLKEATIFTKLLDTGNQAYHSYHMAALGAHYEHLAHKCLEEISEAVVQEPKLPDAIHWQSSVEPSRVASSFRLGPAYWRRNLESCVLFSQAIETLAADERANVDLYIELGPHPALKSSLRQIYARLSQGTGLSSPPFLPSLARNEDSLRSMLVLSGHLFVHNTSVNLVATNATDRFSSNRLDLVRGTFCRDLPSYQYDYGPILYHENRFSRDLRLRTHLRHDILGARQPGGVHNRPSWRNVLRLKDVPWLDDHKLLPNVVFPAAGYIAMVIEALTQIHSPSNHESNVDGISLRDVSLKSMLQVPNDDLGVETILSMHSIALTTSPKSSTWFQFSISSALPNQDTWTEHCSGLISVGTRQQKVQPLVTLCSAQHGVDSEPWYKRFAEHGLGYGPTFRGLSNIQAHRGENLASADLALNPTAASDDQAGARYMIHPAALDTCLQLALIACHAGQVESFRNAYVPTSIGSMNIWATGASVEKHTVGHGVATGELRGLRGAHGNIQLFSTSGNCLLDLHELRCVLYSGPRELQSVVTLHRDPYFRMSWKPDIDSLGNEQARELFPPVMTLDIISPLFEQFERLATYIIVQFSSNQEGKEPFIAPENLRGFLAWIDRNVNAARAGKLFAGLKALSETPKRRTQVIDDLVNSLSDIIEVKLMKRIYDNLPAMLLGTTSSLQVALKDNLLTEVYKNGIVHTSAYPRLTQILDLIAHKTPRMQVLEIGAGTGASTRDAMQVLMGRYYTKRYKTYTFTDVTTGFLSPAQEEFSDCKGMVYKKLDIGADPYEQGFEQIYDLVLATQCLHATPNIAQTISNVRKLLNPGKRLVMLECTRVPTFLGLVFGTFPDYWNGVADGRVDSPFLNREQWNHVLSTNGFSGLDIVLDDLPEPLSLVSTIMSTAIEPVITPLVVQPTAISLVHIIYRGEKPIFADTIAGALQETGLGSLFVSLEDARLLDNPRTISLIDLDESPLQCPTEIEFQSLKALILRASSLLWVSAGGLINASRPSAALILGLMTTIAVEKPNVKWSTVDISPEYEHKDCTIARTIVSKELSLQDDNHTTRQDTQFVMDKGCLHVSRMVSDANLNRDFRMREGLDNTTESQSLASQGPLQLGFEQPGVLDSLYFTTNNQFLTPLPTDHVEIKTKAIGLNMRDIAVVTGRYDENSFSLDCSGEISRVGSSVTSFQPGDRVWGFAPSNFGSCIRAPAYHLQKMSPSDSFATMATIPVSYLTAIYALLHIARLSKEDSVLIQSAAGGLGMAALEVARHVGAEIYVTVGTPEKRQFIMKRYDIDASHIISSGGVSAVASIMERTGGRGVDVILCSAATKQMHETWRCIAPLGRFVQIGPTDVHGDGNFSMEVFRRNATFSSFDIELLFRQKPHLGEKLLIELSEMFASGSIRQPDLVQEFDVADLELAISQFMSESRIGKIVLLYDQPQTILKIKPSPPRASFDPQATYILVGCLGGLGRNLSFWLAERGARHLTYLSRSGAADIEARSMIADLNASGVETLIIKGDVSIKADVENAVACASSARVIKGVINAAMVLEDISFSDLHLPQYQNVLASKVQGSINLHSATIPLPLSFFLMTSSIVSVVGSATQTAYAAASSFQDYFARWRASQGLPAQAFAFGLIAGSGAFTAKPGLDRTSARNGLYLTSESEFLALIEACFVPRATADEERSSDKLMDANLIVGFEPREFAGMYAAGQISDFHWPADPRVGGLMQCIEDLALLQPSSELKEEAPSLLAMESPEEMRLVATKIVIERLSKLLFIAADEIDPEMGVSDYGMDSMIAAELRNWLWRMFQLDISFLELLDPHTKIGHLSERIVESRSAV